MYKDILYEVKDSVARLVLNRPEKLNAIPFSMLGEMVDALHKAEEDDNVKVIILRGAGTSFCAGHDLNDVGFVYGFGDGKTEASRRRRPSQRVRLTFDRKLMENYMAFQYSLKPVIAEVRGHCTGAGIFLVELVDLAICSHDARFSHAEQRLAFAGNNWVLNAQLLTFGPKKTRELMLLSEEFDGREAERIGLVNLSVPDVELETTVATWAQKVARNSRDALVMGKAIHQQALDSLGYSAQVWRGYVGHTLGTNIRFEPDESNFFRERRDRGTHDAFHERDRHFVVDAKTSPHE